MDNQEQNVPLFRATINKSKDSKTGILRISLVECPAIESPVIFLEKESKETLYNFSQIGDQQLITGPVLIPNKIIERSNRNIVFTEQDIVDIRDKFEEQQLNDKMNLQHKIPFQGGYGVESWIKVNATADKSLALGLDPNLPVGTYFKTYKIKDKNTWQAMKDGKIPVTGFSLEGLFAEVLIEGLEKEKMKSKTKSTIFQRALSAVKNLIAQEELSDYAINDGTTMHVDDTSMMATIDGNPASDGNYTTINGDTIVIQSGMMIDMFTIIKQNTEIKNQMETTSNLTTATAENTAIKADATATTSGKTNSATMPPGGDANTPATVNCEKEKTTTVTAEDLSKEKEINLMKENLQKLTTENTELKSQIEKLSKVSANTLDLIPEVTKEDLSKMTTAQKIAYNTIQQFGQK